MTLYGVGSSDGLYYVIEKVKAKTLSGAKRIASKRYEPSMNGHISVFEICEDHFEELSKKIGYDKNWTDIP